MNSRRFDSVGLHIRMPDSLITVAQKALRCNLSFFQCFFIRQNEQRFYRPSSQEIQHFLQEYRVHFSSLYVHASYPINLANTARTQHSLFRHELTLARTLEFTHIILHPGSARGALSRKDGIDALAKNLNHILRYERSVQIVLENVAFGNMVIGGDVRDFAQLLHKIDYPDRLAFCIDTAHAHAFGYALQTAEQCDTFVRMLDDHIGLERIALLHCNDTCQPCGSRRDKHVVLGDGVIGCTALQRIVADERLSHIPVILELPVMHEQHEQEIVHRVQCWRQ